LLPYGRQSIDESDIEAVAKVLRGDWLTTGPSVRAFEEGVALLEKGTDVESGISRLGAAVEAFPTYFQALERLVALAPRSPEPHINLASELVMRAEPQRALDLLLKAQALDPKHISDGLAIVRAQVEFMLGHHDAAIEWRLRARAINPGFNPGDPMLAHKQEESVPMDQIRRCEHQLRTWLEGER